MLEESERRGVLVNWHTFYLLKSIVLSTQVRSTQILDVSLFISRLKRLAEEEEKKKHEEEEQQRARQVQAQRERERRKQEERRRQLEHLQRMREMEEQKRKGERKIKTLMQIISELVQH